MIDHVLGKPSVKSRRLQVLAVLAFWSAYLFRGHRHGPPVVRFLSRLFSKTLTTWQTVVVTMIYLYAARNFSTLVGLAGPEPMANMYDATFFRATWVLTALDAGFWTAMKIPTRRLRDLASMVFSVFYLIAAERADEKVRKVRGNLTVDHLRVSWNKGSASPYLRFIQGLMRPRFTRWPPRAIRIPRPATSDYKEPVSAWLYFDGPLAELEHHTKVVLDIPGGGFVAMDPRCNDDRLLAWASKTGLPILSLDYKKAPEFPYPYALNECYDVYTTLIKSRGRCIGMSGGNTPRVVVSGDSAGGNLAVAMTLMVIESGSTALRRFQGQTELPLPDGLILFYPGLDMNIGNWMSDEQMALIKDRRMRGTNKAIIRRKSMQYNDLVGTPHQSDDEDESTPRAAAPGVDTNGNTELKLPSRTDTDPRSPQPEYSHSGPMSLSTTEPVSSVAPDDTKKRSSTSHRAEPLRTRLAMSSMISYFNDRVLTPEMMRAMIILYIGPHNRPDFSRDYLLSPVLAPDVLLARFPKAYFLTGERDPLVDDTVIFAARLRRVRAAFIASGGSRLDYRDDDLARAEGFDERDAAEVALLPGVSHGFLQFPTLYPPAWRLIDRSAGWIADAFAAAEARARERRSALVNGVSGAAAGNRHHQRQESSGDEDRPLEMSMTRARGRSIRDDEQARMRKAATEQAAAVEGEGEKEDEDEGEGEHKNGGSRRRRRVNGHGRGRDRDHDKSLVKLNSSDDLLGRRMQGLVGGMTGLGDDE